MSKSNIKIIHTLWTKPHFDRDDNFGFDKIETFFNSLILSVNAARQNYNNVILYTDTPGLKLLEPYMNQLPYSKVYNVLDELDSVPIFLWAFPKIYVYSLQLEPFLHIDNDFYLWDNIENYQNNADIICQNKENYVKDRIVFPHYTHALKTIGHLFPFSYNYPDSFALNAGIYGALNEKGLEMFKQMYLDASIILQKIKNVSPNEIDKYIKDSKSINCLIEQAFGGNYISNRQFDIAIAEDLEDFKFTHLMGHLKLSSVEINRLDWRIKNKEYKIGTSAHFSL